MKGGNFAAYVKGQNMQEKVEMAVNLANGLELMVDGMAMRTHNDDEVLPCRECILHGFAQLKIVLDSML